SCCDVQKCNDYLIEQLKGQTTSKGLILISPHMTRKEAEKYLENSQIVGLKPYHLLSDKKPTNQADISEYLPDWAWGLADEYEAIIMLHLVKDGALSDVKNQKEIMDKCKKYPNMKLVLAHGGRGFNFYNTIKGIKSLSGLQNVWFDVSGICESESITAILNEFGPQKLMWGSDFPISQIRGRCVTVGDGFAWLQKDTVNWEFSSIGGNPNPILVGIESLRALKQACEQFCANEQDIQDIFCSNGMRLLGKNDDKGTRTQELYRYAKTRIPGGTQLLSKRPENMAPEQWPPYFKEARGCEVWDLDGRHYYDMYSNGIGACLLGYNDYHVNKAVKRRINLGNMSTLNPPEEVELADLLCEIHPWAEQVRFARSGGEIAAVAVRIARATTDRSVVAVCGYHGWHDWYLAANLGENDALRGHLLPGLEPLGVPRELRNTTIPFRYNRRDEFKNIIDNYGDRLAAVIMEPCRHNDPEPGFLEFVKDEAHKCGALLIFDEITIGWRLHFGGAHLRLGINPDMAIFAKSLGNGYPIGAVIGTKEAMDGAHSSFISSTYWTESIGPTAALAAVKKMQKTDVPLHAEKIGNMVKGYWRKYGEKYNLPICVEDGYPCLATFKFDHELSEQLRTLYTQLMLERGFLAAGSIYVTLAHTEEIISKYGQAIEEVFAEISHAIVSGDVENTLRGPIALSGFKRLIK
ncbi:MAG: aminotransferase class III-fold pyridoxal phosphate-dependent enzyme, partial [Clostridia bacterium]|nr:aminotransferase class III-fold pyridoxal phosphate-dependent enzyme [Clostridia bacterium]